MDKKFEQSSEEEIEQRRLLWLSQIDLIDLTPAKLAQLREWRRFDAADADQSW